MEPESIAWSVADGMLFFFNLVFGARCRFTRDDKVPATLDLYLHLHQRRLDADLFFDQFFGGHALPMIDRDGEV